MSELLGVRGGTLSLKSHKLKLSQTGALEAQNKWLTGEKIALSEQHLLDCAVNYGALKNGCGKGTVTDAFDFIFDNRLASPAFERFGIATSQDYAYVETVGKCKYTTLTPGRKPGYGYVNTGRFIQHSFD